MSGRGRQKVENPRFFRFYQRGRAWAERHGEGEHRDRLLAGLAGRVVEIGAGDGANFERYPDAVTEVVAVEPEPNFRAAATEAAARATVPVRVVDALADELPLGDGEADAVVASLVLCTVPDPAAALAEARRVLRPGGELRFYEHVHADGGPLRVVLELADRSRLWPAIAGGCHPTRDTLAAIEAAGFAVGEVERFSFRPSALAPQLPFVLGRARA